MDLHQSSRTVALSALALVGLAMGAPLAAQTESTVGTASGDHHALLRPLVDLGGAVVDFGTDAWGVVKAPTELDRSGWLQFGGVVATGAALYLVDDEIQGRLEDHPPSALRRGIRDVGDFFEPLGLMGKTNAYYAGAATLFYFAGQERLQLLFKELLYSHWIAGGSRQLVGRAVGRVRPRDGGTASTFEPGEGRSFPSGHSSTIVQLAHVLAHHIDWTPASVALYGLAGTVVFQRVDSGAHWTSDAWIGAAWGLAVANVVIRLEEEGRLPARASLGMSPTPHGVGITLSVPLPR